jgi:uncharacterized membrane protein
VKKSLFARWQANFWAGLAIVLPAVISIAVLRWLFGTIANITDTLLIFLPTKLTHHDGGNGAMYWYWSLVALVLAIFLIGTVGLLARNYFGRKIIEWVDSALLRIPLLNKIYGATKQVNDASPPPTRPPFAPSCWSSSRTRVCTPLGSSPAISRRRWRPGLARK